MANITFIESNGTVHRCDIPTGWSLMKGAVNQGVPGIVAECGGACVCATCHIQVAPEWQDRLPAIEALERDTLDFALDPGEGSRLACQITVRPELEGLVVHVPAEQAG